MEYCIQKDTQFKKVLRIVQIIYILTGIALTIRGCIHGSAYEGLVALATLLLIPGLCLVRHCFRWKGGWQLETYIYLFSYLGWTLGGAGSVYGSIPYFDKLVHCLSGTFVSTIALTLYLMLERRHSKKGENKVTACLFVFFTSMAVAGIFELCEFTLAPVMGRDLQHVLDTGVTDTMMDMFVCLLGTLVFILLMIRSNHGKYDPFTGAANAFVCQNPGKFDKDSLS